MATFTDPAAGTTTTGTTQPAPVPDALSGDQALSPADIQAIRQLYGYTSYWIDDPEIGPILKQAAANHWTADVLRGQIEQTDFWKKHSDAERSWLTLQQQNPGEATQQMHNRAQDIMMAASRMGLSVGQDRANQIAYDAIQYGWGSSEISMALYNEGKRVEATGASQGVTISASGGTIQTGAFQAKQMAHEYFQTLSDADAMDLGLKIATGQLDQASLQAHFATQAAAAFPNNSNMAAGIANGFTPNQIMAPYRQQVGSLLGISPDTIDFTNPKYASILSTSDGKGGTRMMTLDESAKWARSQPEWATSANGMASQASLGKALTEQMGQAIY